ncbi:MAG TPA: HAMP domain-containing sensor histidine kinase [Rhodocyclaceae bacterium]|nr:HAMP domain-containing sensor histidine kinase [Rhodocyclaceae bacterium]
MKVGPLNLKRRVTLALAGMVALFVMVQGGLAFLSMQEQEDDLSDDLVLAEARRLATYIGEDEVMGRRAIEEIPLSPHFSGWLESKGIPNTTMPGYLHDLSEGPHRVSGPHGDVHVFVMPTSQGRLYVQYDAEQSESKVNEFGAYLLGLVLLCIGLGVVAARYIAGLVVAPIERLTRQLTDWAPDSVMHENVSDEEGQLLDAFRRVQERFEQVVAHEREFVANARHEIRTPLTALRTDLEMLILSAGPAAQERLQRAIGSVDAIAGSLELAHTLTHRQSAMAQNIDLAACVDDAWSSLAEIAHTQLAHFHNAVAAGTQVCVDRHALLTILRNLIRNAAEHAGSANCRVEFTARGIEVIDDGVGIAEADLPFVFDRYYRARLIDTSGQVENGERGLGLAIARQIADLHGWQLQVESKLGEGTRFILSLSSH